MNTKINEIKIYSMSVKLLHYKMYLIYHKYKALRKPDCSGLRLEYEVRLSHAIQVSHEEGLTVKLPSK